MPGCSNRPAELDRPKYRIGNQRKHGVARRCDLSRVVENNADGMAMARPNATDSVP